MKKALAILLVYSILMTLLVASPFTANADEKNVAETGAIGGTTGECTWELDDDGTLTISGNGSMDNYTDAFFDRMPPWSRATSVIIEDGVTFIGDDAFYNCKNVQNINIPESVTDIGYRAFDRCYNLSSIIIGNNVSSIASEAFYNCTSLKSVTIPNNVTSIKVRAFGYYYDYDLESTCKIDNFTIYGNPSSVAEKYANNNNFKFIALDDEPSDPTKTTDREIFGDIDGDGVITIVDSTFLQRYTIHAETPYPIGEKIK